MKTLGDERLSIVEEFCLEEEIVTYVVVETGIHNGVLIGSRPRELRLGVIVDLIFENTVNLGQILVIITHIEIKFLQLKLVQVPFLFQIIVL